MGYEVERLSKAVVTFLIVAITFFASRSYAEPMQIGTFDHWNLIRDINPDSQTGGRDSYCAIVDKSVLSDSSNNSGGIVILEDEHENLAILIAAPSNTIMGSNTTATIAFSDGTIMNINARNNGKAIVDQIVDENVKTALFNDLIGSETLTVTFANADSQSYYLGDSTIAVKAFTNCLVGLPGN